MKTFEEFVASREKNDPSAKNMTDHQWTQAYSAYCSSRERLRKSSSHSDDDSSTRRYRSRSTRGAHRPSASTPASALKQRVREQSAYHDLRLIVDMLAWVAVAVIIINSLLKMSMGVNVFTVVVPLLGGALSVLIALVIKLLIQVLIDIPDVALYRYLKERTEDSNSDGSDSEA